MLLINGENYPRYMGDLQVQYPDWSEGDALPDGWSEVQELEQPLAESGKKVVEVFPTIYRGRYKQAWSQVDLSTEEQSLINQRLIAAELIARLDISEEELLAIKTIIV